MGSLTPLEPPTIHISIEKLKPGTSDWDLVCSDVQRALEHYGWFEAVYDNVDLDLHNAIFGTVEDLFDLPMETKQRNVIPDRPYFGYIGNLPSNPLFETMGIYDATLERIESFTNLMWPEGNDSFCKLVHEYTTRVSELDKIVKKMIFQFLGVDKYYNSLVESSCYLFRSMKYAASKTKEPVTAGSDHTDINFLTILHQNQVKGLEFQTKSGEWIQFTPTASSFIVLMGDSFSAWSNGRLHSPRHRIKMSGDETRYSIGLFAFCKGIIQCPEELVDEQHPVLFKPFDHIGALDFLNTEEGLKAESALKAYCGL